MSPYSIPTEDIIFICYMCSKYRIAHLLELPCTVHYVIMFLRSVSGFVHVLKTREFQESDFKFFKVVETGFWTLKVLDFSLNGM